MPVVGFGTSRTEDPGSQVEIALSAGYRHFDCALCYENEHEIGKALTKMLKSGAVKREDLFITGKVWGTSNRGNLVEASCEQTLSDLQLEYLDLFLIHSPIALQPGMGTLEPLDSDGVPIMDSDPPPFSETWGAMERLVEAGKCKNIGLSNFNISQIQEILDCAKIKPANLQVESHPFFPNLELLEFCCKNDISFVAYGPLGSPGRTWMDKDQPSLLEDEDVLKIAQKHGVSAGQVLIRYQVDKGNAVIVKSGKLSRMKENLDVFQFSLDSSDMDCLHNLYKKAGPNGYRAFDFRTYSHSPYFPFELD
ncbi:hypothetical protein ACHWQZ_G005762 [Mnemiopsis leidyi]